MAVLQTPPFDPRVFVDHHRLMGCLWQGATLRIDSIINRLSRSGNHYSRRRGQGLSFEELRAYQQGDDVRRIDWKVTNRTGKPHVTMHSEDRERQALIVLDQSSSMFFGSQNYMKSVVAAELMALLTGAFIQQGDPVGLLAFDDKEVVLRSPSKSRRASEYSLKETVRLNQQYSQPFLSLSNSQFNAALRKARNMISADGLVVIISGFNAWDHQSEALVAQLTQHNTVLPILVFDDNEDGHPNQESLNDSLIISNGKQQLDVPSSMNLDTLLAQKFEARVQAVKQCMNKIALPLSLFDSNDSAEMQVRKVFDQPLPKV